jgi:mRNA-degrading endonuclease toxin of MazEF toxin-antitoxin module
VTAPVPRPRRGQLWWLYLPGQPNDPHQPRPALIISTDSRNRVTDDVIVVPVFSRGALGPLRVALPAGAGGIARASVLFCDEVSTLNVAFLAGGPLGGLVPATLLDAVVRGIRRAIGEVVPEPDSYTNGVIRS